MSAKDELCRAASCAARALFPTSLGGPLSRDAVERLVTKHAETAAAKCPSLAGKKATPHTLRHTTGMALLRGGVDIAVIAMWLGTRQLKPPRSICTPT